MIVKPQAALRQRAAVKVEPKEQPGDEVLPTGSKASTPSFTGKKDLIGQPQPDDSKPILKRRFHGSVNLDAARIARDAGQIAEEVVQHLVKIPGAVVSISLEIQAHLPQGASNELSRTVSENCKTLKFLVHDFEGNNLLIKSFRGCRDPFSKGS
ncbi:MAG: hypothetical protein MUF15_05850 [Acidobacteria bacterium]|nr:hypothetical protein [Acidobacteriota bacterium]